MKKIIILLLLGVGHVYAGAGIFIEIINNSNFSMAVTGRGAGGNICWYSNDLDNRTIINPMTSKTIYTEIKNSGICNYFLGNRRYYQRFLMTNNSSQDTIFMLGTNLSPSLNLVLQNLTTSKKTNEADFDQLSAMDGRYCARILISEEGKIDDSQMALWKC